MRKLIILVVSALCLIASPAFAAKSHPTLCQKAFSIRAAVIKKHGKRAPGRNICRLGVVSKFNAKWSKPATTKQKATYLRALRVLNTSNPFMVAGQPLVPPAGTATPRANLPWCTWGPESGGDYSASNGTHFGKYQFDLSTWQSVGGSGNPASASPAEQDRRAAMLYAQRGGQPWVNC
jgi:hypothetical protein